MSLKEKAAALRETQTAHQTPTEENGTRLALIPRGDDEALMLHWSEFKGRPYIQARIWRQNAVGLYRPTKVGTSIRLSELPAVADAIETALDMALKHEQEAAKPVAEARPSGKRRGRPRGSRNKKTSADMSASLDFNDPIPRFDA